jgi:regulatory protein
MAGTITALKIQKRSKERVNLFLDDEYAFSVSLSVAATLKKEQYLSDADIEQLKDQYEQYKAYQHAVRFLSFRSRSQMEVENHLRSKDYAPDVISQTIERLTHEQVLDDEAFVRFWLEDRERFRPRGERGLRYELRQKGIADEVIDTVLADLDEDQLAWAAVEPKLRQWQQLDEANLKKKIFGFLSRRGFAYDVAQTVCRRAWESLHESN